MAFNFLELNSEVRDLMLSEVEYDVENNSLYYSRRFSNTGHDIYLELLKEAIKGGTEESLGGALNSSGTFLTQEERKTKTGIVMAKIPMDAAYMFADGEFNRFFMRAVCLKAIKENSQVEVYRAKQVSSSRSESEAKIGQKIDPTVLLNDLRINVGTDTALKLPPGPNSGLSVKIS